MTVYVSRFHVPSGAPVHSPERPRNYGGQQLNTTNNRATVEALTYNRAVEDEVA